MTMVSRFLTESLIGTTAVALVLVSAGSVSADMVTFAYTGTVTSVNADAGSPSTFGATLNNTFNTSQLLSGTYSFDSEAVDTNINVGNPDLATYALVAFNFNIGGFNGGTGSNNWIQIINAHAGVPYFGDLYAPTMVNSSGDTIEGIAPHRFGIDLRDTVSKTALSDDLLPLSPPELSLFTSTTWELRFDELNTSGGSEASDYRHTAKGEITSITVVPEPTATILCVTGLLMAGYRIGRKRL